MMKTIAFVLAAMMFSSAAFATNSTPPSNTGTGKTGQPGPNFAARKQKILDEIAQRIQRLQAVQNCVQNAQDHEAMKACHEQFPGKSGGRN